MSAYEEELQLHGQIDGDPIMDLVHALPQSPLMENCHVFVDGFHWFTPVHFELLYMLFDLAVESVITVDYQLTLNVYWLIKVVMAYLIAPLNLGKSL